MPQFTSSFFDTISIHTNSFSSLDASCESFGPPEACSSPKAVNTGKHGNKQKSWNMLNILNVNFRSIKNKKVDLLEMIDGYNPSILIVTETWLNQAIHISEFFPPNYNVHRKDRPDGFSGVLIGVRSDFICDRIDISSTTESVYISLALEKGRQLIVGALYRPPSSSVDYIDCMCNEIEQISTKYKKATMWLGGDLNLPDINWSTQSIEGNSNSTAINRRFLNCIHQCGLEQMVDFPTRQSSTLDLFLTNRPSLVDKCFPAPGPADHDIVCISSSASVRKSRPVRRKIYLWSKANLPSMQEECQSITTTFCKEFDHTSQVEAMWTFIKDKLLYLQDKHVPAKLSSTSFSQPWATREVKASTRRKKKSFWKAKSTGRAKDYTHYKLLKHKARSTCKSAYNDYLRTILSDESTSNPKRFWGFIKSMRSDSSGVAPLKDNTGVTHSESKQKADILNAQFSSVFNKDEQTSTIPDKGPSPYPGITTVTVGLDGVQKLLAGLQIHKATGPDNISCRTLKELSHQLAPMLQIFFQASLDQGIIPSDWKRANVVPIYKKGEKNKAENYRPVSLTSVMCKLLEHIVCSNIMQHLDKHNILHDAQHGFRKRRSCESQLIITINDLARNIDSKGQTDVILLDFSKAFDKVPHKRLLYKLQHYGITNNLHAWIENFLDGRTQQVLLEGKTSNTAQVQSGVPQGSVLGPLLFLLFINDLPDCVSPESTVRLFADDCVLYRNIKNTEDANQLQADLNGLQQWETDWLMEFHPKKCQVLHVTNKRNIVNQSYTIHGHTLEVVDTAKYLGVHIHKSLSWNHHINEVTKKANSTLGFLRRNIHQCPPTTKALCYRTLVRPLTEYASTIWDPHTAANINKLEMVQRRAARMVMSDYRSTSSVTSMLNQLQWSTLQERRAQAKAVMMYRVVYQLIDIPLYILVPIISPRGNNITFLVPYARTLMYQKSFFPDTIRIWNSLPSEVVTAPSIDSFRTRIQTINMRQ